MKRKIALIWMGFSAVCWLSGSFLARGDNQSEFAFWLNFGGWLSFLLALGLFSIPSGPSGKIAFGWVIIMVIGIAFKILHFTGGNVMIIAGLVGLLITYSWIWFTGARR